LKLVIKWEFSHQPQVLLATCCILGRRSQHMLCLAKLKASIWCCCVNCSRTCSFRSPLDSGIRPLTFWKHIQIVLCFSPVVDPTFLDNLDLNGSPHPRMEQDPLLWVVPWFECIVPGGGPHLLRHHASASCWAAGSTCVTSGMALRVVLGLGCSQ